VLGTEPQLKQVYVKTGQVRLVFVPMLDHGDRSVQTHQAAECAGEEGRFWALHDLLFAQQGQLWGGDIRESIKALAVALELDSAQFNACIDEQRYVELVQRQDQVRRAAGIRSRPTLVVNGQMVIGPQPFEVFQAIIEPLLAP
jgi:protein-disulfide isomerase